MEEELRFEDEEDVVDPGVERERQLLARVYGEGFDGVLVKDFSENEDGEPAKGNEFGLTTEVDGAFVGGVKENFHSELMVAGRTSEMNDSDSLSIDEGPSISTKGVQGSFRTERRQSRRRRDRWDD